MPQYVALKTFLGRYGTMHRGMTYTLPDGYGRDLMHNGLVRLMSRDHAPVNAAHAEAPVKLGEGTEARQGDGTALPLSVLLPARPSLRRTLTTRNRGPK